MTVKAQVSKLLSNKIPLRSSLEDVKLLDPSNCDDISITWLKVSTDKKQDTWRFQDRILFYGAESDNILCLHRWKIWWMIPSYVPVSTTDGIKQRIPPETLLLLGKVDAETFLVMIPVQDQHMEFSLEGCSLNGCLHINGHENRLQCDDSSSTFTERKALLILTGPLVHELLELGFGLIRSLLNERDVSMTYLPRHTDHCLPRATPSFMKYFGWCTWDACYTNLSTDKIIAGITTLSEGGAAPGYLILDDGWQDTTCNYAQNGEQWQGRLTSFHANHKFSPSLKDCIDKLKTTTSINTFMVWHAFHGYWLGVDEASTILAQYKPCRLYPFLTDSLKRMSPAGQLTSETFNTWGISLASVEHSSSFYYDYHASLLACGVDGVKVDVQSIVPLLTHTNYSAIEATRRMHEGLKDSVTKHFPGTQTSGCDSLAGNVIHCMSHSQTTMFSLLKSYDPQHPPIVRGSDDYWPSLPASHSVHIAVNALNSLFMSYCGIHDWDMFQTDMSEGASLFHAAARAISGGPIYVSDRIGCHDHTVLRRMMLSSMRRGAGWIPLCQRNGRPVQRLLLSDCQRQPKTPLMIQNYNSNGSLVIGVFQVFGSIVENDYELYRVLRPDEIIAASDSLKEVLQSVTDQDNDDVKMNSWYDVWRCAALRSVRDSSVMSEKERRLVDELSIDCNVSPIDVDEVHRDIYREEETHGYCFNKEYVAYSYKHCKSSMSECDDKHFTLWNVSSIQSTVPVSLYGPFDFDIVSFAPKHYLPFPYNNLWVACLGDVSLLNPSGCVLELNIGESIVDKDDTCAVVELKVPKVMSCNLSLVFSTAIEVKDVRIDQELSSHFSIVDRNVLMKDSSLQEYNSVNIDVNFVDLKVSTSGDGSMIDVVTLKVLFVKL